MILLTTDEHFGVKSNNIVVFESYMKFYEEQVFPYILKNNITHYLSLGDFFDSRTTINLYILQQLKQRFFRWLESNKIHFHVLVGNHTSYFDNSLDCHFFKENTNEFEYIHYYDTITTITINNYRIAMIPWLCGNKDVIFPEADIIAGHFETISFPMVKGIECKDGFRVSDFNDYTLCLSGHYHLRNTKGNVTYIGNPYQKDWSDFKENKGFAVLDDNYNLTFIENTVSSKHLKIYYTESKIMLEGE